MGLWFDSRLALPVFCGIRQTEECELLVQRQLRCENDFSSYTDPFTFQKASHKIMFSQLHDMQMLCVHSVKVCPATVGQSHPALSSLLLESQCQSEKRVMDERVQPLGGKKKKKKKSAGLRQSATPIPPGSTPPLYPHQKLLNYSQSLRTVTYSKKNRIK